MAALFRRLIRLLAPWVVAVRVSWMHPLYKKEDPVRDTCSTYKNDLSCEVDQTQCKWVSGECRQRCERFDGEPQCEEEQFCSWIDGRCKYKCVHISVFSCKVENHCVPRHGECQRDCSTVYDAASCFDSTFCGWVDQQCKQECDTLGSHVCADESHCFLVHRRCRQQCPTLGNDELRCRSIAESHCYWDEENDMCQWKCNSFEEGQCAKQARCTWSDGECRPKCETLTEEECSKTESRCSWARPGDAKSKKCLDRCNWIGREEQQCTILGHCFWAQGHCYGICDSLPESECVAEPQCSFLVGKCRRACSTVEQECGVFDYCDQIEEQCVTDCLSLSQKTCPEKSYCVWGGGECHRRCRTFSQYTCPWKGPGSYCNWSEERRCRPLEGNELEGESLG